MKFDVSKADLNKLLSFCYYEILVCVSSEGINSWLESKSANLCFIYYTMQEE